ncbi:MAG: HIT domain-containing protein [Chloroflexi bacterium]|nr:HIT domain-containing protein [Chloroflexota bacterium]
MERLWTPWRSAYVASDKSGGCFLCEKPREDKDEANLILFRTKHGFILLNTFPYNSGHLMVAPYSHTGSLGELPPAVGAGLWELTRRAVDALAKEYRPDGFNVGMNLGKAAGAGAPDHLHIHIVPRWAGDTNYMPVIAGTKVLPEALDQTYQRLAPHLRAR